MLDLAKIEAGHMTLYETAFSLPDILVNLESVFWLRAEAKQLQFTVVRGDDLPSFVKTVERKLRQVLINLLNNAIKFTESGFVTLRVTRGASAGPDCWLRFEVVDSGPGIAPEELGLLFQAFSQTEVAGWICGCR